jgi:hypothetical protein
VGFLNLNRDIDRRRVFGCVVVRELADRTPKLFHPDHRCRASVMRNGRREVSDVGSVDSEFPMLPVDLRLDCGIFDARGTVPVFSILDVMSSAGRHVLFSALNLKFGAA